MGTYPDVLYKQLVSFNEAQASRIMELEHKVRTMYMDGNVAEDSLKEDNVIEVDFSVPRVSTITGGRPPSDTWLTRLKTGTCFVVRPKSFKGWLLQEFCHGGRRNNAVMLIIMDSGQRLKFEWCDPERFCQEFDLYEIVEEPENEVLCDS